MKNLYWNTASPLLRTTLEDLMNSALFAPFRLVGGTSLALQLGHRESIDIDLFTDAEYGSIDFSLLDSFLRKKYSYVSNITSGLVGMGRQYFVGESEGNPIKLDLYYTDAFIRSPLIVESIRMASIEEIIAMKMDVVQRGGRKKDFWDLHELLDSYSIERMIELHEERYPYYHNRRLILENIIDFNEADGDFEPKCLRGKHWELIKLDIVEAVKGG
ncbi:MAG: nucleotidyl transferase AbiEii/AbiGii toxin family protein [Bacteroidetes bacterium]|nr:nucleotidyl transferase AbiEii/AbiGii toxin family protein [Bacteroidota bacterium]